jgi:hypothetical protein
MKTYIGVKIVEAEPQSSVKSGQIAVEGYKVIYPDGYTSWSPKATFEAAYREVNEGKMTFGLALEALKKGLKVARIGWNGKGMWLSLSGRRSHKVHAEDFWSENNADYAHEQLDHYATVLPCITMKTATGEILMGWLASQTDMLSEDWVIVP